MKKQVPGSSFPSFRFHDPADIKMTPNQWPMALNNAKTQAHPCFNPKTNKLALEKEPVLDSSPDYS